MGGNPGIAEQMPLTTPWASPVGGAPTIGWYGPAGGTAHGGAIQHRVVGMAGGEVERKMGNSNQNNGGEGGVGQRPNNPTTRPRAGEEEIVIHKPLNENNTSNNEVDTIQNLVQALSEEELRRLLRKNLFCRGINGGRG